MHSLSESKVDCDTDFDLSGRTARHVHLPPDTVKDQALRRSTKDCGVVVSIR